MYQSSRIQDRGKTGVGIRPEQAEHEQLQYKDQSGGASERQFKMQIGDILFHVDCKFCKGCRTQSGGCSLAHKRPVLGHTYPLTPLSDAMND